jgi:hypothetical protein
LLSSSRIGCWKATAQQSFSAEAYSVRSYRLSPPAPLFTIVMSAKAGIQGDQCGLATLDSHLRGNDGGIERGLTTCPCDGPARNGRERVRLWRSLRSARVPPMDYLDDGQRSVEPTRTIDHFGSRACGWSRPRETAFTAMVSPRPLRSLFGWPRRIGARPDFLTPVSMRLRRQQERPIRVRAPLNSRLRPVVSPAAAHGRSGGDVEYGAMAPPDNRLPP